MLSRGKARAFARSRAVKGKGGHVIWFSMVTCMSGYGKSGDLVSHDHVQGRVLWVANIVRHRSVNRISVCTKVSSFFTWKMCKYI
jgi:hypothetical protein